MFSNISKYIFLKILHCTLKKKQIGKESWLPVKKL